MSDPGVKACVPNRSQVEAGASLGSDPGLELQVKVVNPDEVLTKGQQEKTYAPVQYSVAFEFKVPKPWWWDEPAGPFAAVPPLATASNAPHDWAATMNAILDDFNRAVYGAKASSARPAQDPNYGLARALPSASGDE